VGLHNWIITLIEAPQTRPANLPQIPACSLRSSVAGHPSAISARHKGARCHKRRIEPSGSDGCPALPMTTLQSPVSGRAGSSASDCQLLPTAGFLRRKKFKRAMCKPCFPIGITHGNNTHTIVQGKRAQSHLGLHVLAPGQSFKLGLCQCVNRVVVGADSSLPLILSLVWRSALSGRLEVKAVQAPSVEFGRHD
jgi:hypothetical protein